MFVVEKQLIKKLWKSIMRKKIDLTEKTDSVNVELS